MLERGVGFVEIQRVDHFPVTADFRVAHRDAPVEPLVRGNTRWIFRQMKLDHVSREQNPPITPAEDGVPVEMTARVTEFDAWRKLQLFVVRMIG